MSQALMNAATLEVNLSAIAENYRRLRARHAAHAIAAVVKANAYGLGMEAVGLALWQAGCRDFFVATLEEGIDLRRFLPQAAIGVFQGLLPGEEKDYTAHRLTPVLNDPGQVERFARGLGNRDWELGIIHVDTGMTRLGLTQSDLEILSTQSPIPNPQSLTLMSHLACADEPDHPLNAEQLARFEAARRCLPHARASLANSSGLFLPDTFHFDLGRPGCALYGINPVNGENPMRPVATLSAPILQIRTLDRDEHIGYGATAAKPAGSRIAIAALGYADGYPRALGNVGVAYVAGHKAPVAGRVSMDMAAIDISHIPLARIDAHTRVEFINAQHTVDDVADACGTIGYEIFTRLGERIKRVYT